MPNHHLARSKTSSRTSECLTVAVLITGALLAWRQLPPAADVNQPAANVKEELTTAEIDLTNRPSLGSQSARVILLQFTDFHCPFCARFASDLLPALKSEFIDPGHLRMVFKHLPLESIHPRAMVAASAAACAREFGGFWPMHDFLFRSPSAGDVQILKAAELAGIDPVAYTNCLRAGPLEPSLDLQEARRLGLEATPAFIIGTPGDGQRFHIQSRQVGAALPRLRAAITAALRRD